MPAFKYKDLTIKIIAVVLILIIGIILEVGWIKKEGVLPGLGFLFFFSLFFLFIFVTAILGASDIVIDDQGMSRSLFGYTWQSINWQHVEYIHVATGPDIEVRRMVRVIYIYQSSSVWPIPFLKGRRIFFRVLMENADEFIECMNFYISKYNIRVESTEHDIKKSVDRL